MEPEFLGEWFKGFCSYATLSGIVEMLGKK